MFSVKFLATSLKAILIALMVTVGLCMAMPTAEAATYKILMGSDKGELKFEPSELTISVGDTVEWVNNKVYPHNVVFDKVPGGDSSLAKQLSYKRLMTKPGQVVEDTFEVPGEYSYYCTPHRGAQMVGKITVEG